MVVVGGGGEAGQGDGGEVGAVLPVCAAGGVTGVCCRCVLPVCGGGAWLACVVGRGCSAGG